MNKYFESKDFHDGYNAAALYEPFDNTKSREWQNGWNQYQNDIDRTESVKWV